MNCSSGPPSHQASSSDSIGHNYGGENSQQVEIGHTHSLTNTTTIGVEAEIKKDAGVNIKLENSLALGFEHCIANMYFIPLGILLKGDPGLMTSLGTTGAALEGLSGGGLVANLVPVTLGNIVGGTLMVAGVYWFAYLRPKKDLGE